jgi:hypothetical protein
VNEEVCYLIIQAGGKDHLVRSIVGERSDLGNLGKRVPETTSSADPSVYRTVIEVQRA